MGERSGKPEQGGQVATKRRERLETPRNYRVLLHNDDYTTMDFVIEVLVEFFSKSATEAMQIMLQVHHDGIGVAGVYTYDVASTKVVGVTDKARAAGMPLMVTMEPE